MRTIEQRNFTSEQMGRVDEFVKVSILLKEDELQAIDKQIPMTQELFDRLCDRLSQIGAQNYFLQLLSEYPHFLAISGKEIEKEIEDASFAMPEITNEKYDEIYARIKEKICQTGE